jgi:DNA-binding GntR family transcriptional regulator
MPRIARQPAKGPIATALRPTKPTRLALVEKNSASATVSLTQQAYEQIEEKIVKLELRPGQALSEAGLSALLGIGRTPVREALQRLAREHLVLILPQRGILVSMIDIKLQLRLLETRREIERLIMVSAARRCTPTERDSFLMLAKEFIKATKSGDQNRFMRADKAFNDLSVSSARNEFAAAAMGLMHGLSRRFWYLHHQQADDLSKMGRLHAEIAQAIGEGNEIQAGKALDALIDHNEAFTKLTVSTDF